MEDHTIKQMPIVVVTETSPLLHPADTSSRNLYLKNFYKITRAILGFGVPSMLLAEYFLQTFEKEGEFEPVYVAIAVGFLAAIAETLGLRNNALSREKLNVFLKYLEASRECSSLMGMALNISFKLVQLSSVKPETMTKKALMYGGLVSASVLTGLFYFKPMRHSLRRQFDRLQDGHSKQFLKALIKRADYFLQALLTGYQATVIYPITASIVKQVARVEKMGSDFTVSIGRFILSGAYGLAMAMIMPYLNYHTAELWEKIQENLAVMGTYFLEEIEAATIEILPNNEHKEKSFNDYLPLIMMSGLFFSTIILVWLVTPKINFFMDEESLGSTLPPADDERDKYSKASSDENCEDEEDAAKSSGTSIKNPQTFNETRNSDSILTRKNSTEDIDSMQQQPDPSDTQAQRNSATINVNALTNYLSKVFQPTSGTSSTTSYESNANSDSSSESKSNFSN